MSIGTFRKIWKTSNHKGAALLTLLAIAYSEDENGTSFLSHNNLANLTRQSTRGVQRSIKALEKTGELKVNSRLVQLMS